MSRIKSVLIGLLVIAGLSLSPGMAAAAPRLNFPEVIDLPDGFQPEGVAMGYATTIYAGSLATGAIYRVDVRTGAGSLLVPPQAGRAALGLEFDARSGHLFVAGGPTGSAYVYDGQTGATLAVFTLTTETPTFVNDAVVTRDAVYFTDSSRPVLYRVRLGPGGRLPGAGAVQEIPLGGDYEFVPGAFNANGIEAAPNGKALVIVHTALGRLYRVEPATGDAALIDLGGASVMAGDGLLWAGKTLYVVQNFLNQISAVTLDPGLASGEVAQVLTDPDFDIPTTVTLFGTALYAVNARFTTPPMADTPYWIAQLPRVP